MRITDINVSIGGRNAGGTAVTAAELIRQMDLYEIGHAVCWHEYTLSDPKEGNGLMREAADASGGRLGVSAVLDPVLGAESLPGEGSLTERIRALKPESLHIFPDNARTVFHPLYWEEILEAAEELSLPLIIDCDYQEPFFYALPEVSRLYPRVKFVLVRYGLCRSRHIFPLLEKRDNIYITLEHLLDDQQIEEICGRGQGGKIFFASSYPKLPFTGPLGLALYADVSAGAKEKLLWKNWEAVRG